jgi:hypothetical protein
MTPTSERKRQMTTTEALREFFPEASSVSLKVFSETVELAQRLLQRHAEKVGRVPTKAEAVDAFKAAHTFHQNTLRELAEGQTEWARDAVAQMAADIWNHHN